MITTNKGRISIDGSFSGVNYGSFIENEKRLNETLRKQAMSSEMKYLKNTGLQFNFLTYSINNNYQETIFNEIEKDYNSLIDINKIQEEHLNTINDIYVDELIETLNIIEPEGDYTYNNIENKNYDSYSFVNRKISYIYTHNLLTNSDLCLTSIKSGIDISYNMIMQSYIPYVHEDYKIYKVSNSLLADSTSIKYHIMSENDLNVFKLSNTDNINIEFDHELSADVVNSVKYIGNDNLPLYEITFNETYTYTLFNDKSNTKEGLHFRALPIYGSIFGNNSLIRAWNIMFRGNNRNNYIKHYICNSNLTTIDDYDVLLNSSDNNDIKIQYYICDNINCLIFSLSNKIKEILQNNNCIRTSFMINNKERLSIYWKPIFSSIIFKNKNDFYLKSYDIEEKIKDNAEILINGSTFKHFDLLCEDENSHYKLSNIKITEYLNKVNAYPKIWRTDDKGFDLYGVGKGLYNLELNVVGQFGEKITLNYKINISTNELLNTCDYVVEDFNYTDYSLKINFKTFKNYQLPTSINVKYDENSAANVLHSAFIKDVKYINWDFNNWPDTNITDKYFASAIIYFDKNNLLHLIDKNNPDNQNKTDEEYIIDKLSDYNFSLNVYYFTTKNNKDVYDVYNIQDVIIQNQVSQINIVTLEEINDNNKTDIDKSIINDSGLLYNTQELKNIFTANNISWKLYDNDKRLYDCKISISDKNLLLLTSTKENTDKSLTSTISITDIDNDFYSKYDDIELLFVISETDYIKLIFDAEVKKTITSSRYTDNLLIDPNSIRLEGILNNHFADFYIDNNIKGVYIDKFKQLVWNPTSHPNTFDILAKNDFCDIEFTLTFNCTDCFEIIEQLYESEGNFVDQTVNFYTIDKNTEYHININTNKWSPDTKLYLYYFYQHYGMTQNENGVIFSRIWNTYKPLNILQNDNSFILKDGFDLAINDEILAKYDYDNGVPINPLRYIFISDNPYLEYCNPKNVLVHDGFWKDSDNSSFVTINTNNDFYPYDVYAPLNRQEEPENVEENYIFLSFDYVNSILYENKLNNILRKVLNTPIYHFNDVLSNYPKDSNYDNILDKNHFYRRGEMLHNGQNGFINVSNQTYLFIVNNRFLGIDMIDNIPYLSDYYPKYYSYTLPEVPFNPPFKSPHISYCLEDNTIFDYFMLYSNISKLYTDFSWNNTKNLDNMLYSTLKFNKYVSNVSLKTLCDNNIINSYTPEFRKFIGYPNDIVESNMNGFGNIFNRTHIKNENVLDLFFKNKNEYAKKWNERIEAYDNLLKILNYFDEFPKDEDPFMFAVHLVDYLYPWQASFAQNNSSMYRNTLLTKLANKYTTLTDGRRKNIVEWESENKQWNNFLYSQIISKFIPTDGINENILSDISTYGLRKQIVIPSNTVGITYEGKFTNYLSNSLDKTHKQYTYIYDNNSDLIGIGYIMNITEESYIWSKESLPQYYIDDNHSYLGLTYYSRYDVVNGNIVPTTNLNIPKNTFTYTIDNVYRTVKSITNTKTKQTAYIPDNQRYYIVSNDGSYITSKNDPIQHMNPKFDTLTNTYQAYTINFTGRLVPFSFDENVEKYTHKLQIRTDNKIIYGRKHSLSSINISYNTNNTIDLSKYGLYNQSYNYGSTTYIYNVVKQHEYRNIEKAIQLQQFLCKYVLNEVEKTSLMLNIFENSKKLLKSIQSIKYDETDEINNVQITGVELFRDYITTDTSYIDLKISYNDAFEGNGEFVETVYLPKNTYLSWIDNDHKSSCTYVQIDDRDLFDSLNTYNSYFWHQENNYTFTYIKNDLVFDNIILTSDLSNASYIYFEDVIPVSITGPEWIPINMKSYNKLEITNQNHKFFTYSIENNKINYTTYDDPISDATLNGFWNGYYVELNNELSSINHKDFLSYVRYTKSDFYKENQSYISLSYSYEFEYKNNLISFDIKLPAYPMESEKWECDIEIGYNNLPHKYHQNESYIWITPKNTLIEPFGIWSYIIRDIDVIVQENYRNNILSINHDKYTNYFYNNDFYKMPWAYTNTDILNIGNLSNYNDAKNYNYDSSMTSGFENTTNILLNENIFDAPAAKTSNKYVSKIHNYIFNENQPFDFYLGSMAEWQLVSDNIQEIAEKMRQINGDNLYDGQKIYNDPSYYLYWTSSEESQETAWNIFLNECSFREQNKNNYIYVRPFFKLKEVNFKNAIYNINFYQNTENTDQIIPWNEDVANNFTNNVDGINENALKTLANLSNNFYVLNIIYKNQNLNNLSYSYIEYNNINVNTWQSSPKYFLQDMDELTLITYNDRKTSGNFTYEDYINNNIPDVFNQESQYIYRAVIEDYDNTYIPGCSLAYILDKIIIDGTLINYTVTPIDLNDFDFSLLMEHPVEENLDTNLSYITMLITPEDNKIRYSEYSRIHLPGGSLNSINTRIVNNYDYSYSFIANNNYNGTDNTFEKNIWNVSLNGKSIYESIGKFINFRPGSILLTTYNGDLQHTARSNKNITYEVEFELNPDFTSGYLTYNVSLNQNTLNNLQISGTLPVVRPNRVFS